MRADPNVITFPVKTKLVCSGCSAPGEGSCNCGLPYVTPRERAEAAVKANPDKTARVIAKETGIPKSTVIRAAKRAVDPNGSTERRTGKDGKSYKATKPATPKPPPPVKPVDDKGRVAGVDIKVDPVLWQAFNEKAQRERKSATAVIAELITDHVDGRAPVELPKTAQEKLTTAIRQHQRKLDAEHAARMKALDEEVRKRVIAEGKEYLAMLKEREAKVWSDEKHWREMANNHQPLFTADQFKTILMCLHPDGQRTEEKLSSAFRLFNAKKKQLTGEKS